jgi:uncharacterized protein YifE (UPF0438 family)
MLTKNVGLTSSLVDQFLEAQRYDDNYGWLSPTGEFSPSEFGDHEQWAADYIDEHDLEDEYFDWYEKRYTDGKRFGLGIKGDFLVYEKGFVLLHNPANGLAQITASDIKPLTKKQKEFLFDYYTERNKHEEAAKYLSE